MRFVGKTVAFEWLAEARTLLSVSGSVEPAMDDWERYVDAIRAHQEQEARVLVIAGRGKPSRAQQQQLTALPNHGLRRIALISESLPLRFIVAMFALVAPQVKLFPPAELHEALGFLGLQPRETGAVRDSLSRLRAEFQEQHSAT